MGSTTIETPAWAGPPSDAELRQFQTQGFLAYQDVLTPLEVEQAKSALTEVILDYLRRGRAGKLLVREYQSGTGPSNYAGTLLTDPDGGLRLRFEAGVRPFKVSADEAELLVRVMYFFYQDHQVFQRLVKSSKILSIVEALIGPGALLFQDMALVKPARIGSEKPWHQDDAYFSYAPLDQIVGVWLALDEATTQNGCMHVLPSDHLRGGLKHYDSAADCEIMPDRIDQRRSVPIELRPGGALFFGGLVPHRTPPNRSEKRRRAVQLHYRSPATRKLDRSEYDTVFTDPDGTPASCIAAHSR